MQYRALTALLTRVDTTARYNLGDTVQIPDNIYIDYASTSAYLSGETYIGPATFVYVFNDEASTALAEGEVAVYDTDFIKGNVIRSNGVAIAPERVVGVAQWAIAAGSYGWILKEGRCAVECDGNVTSGTRIVTDTAGQVTDVTTNSDATTDNVDAAFGVALATDAGAGTLVAANVVCKG